MDERRSQVRRLGPVILVLVAAAVAGLIALGVRTVRAERVVAERNVRARLSAGARESAAVLAGAVGRLEAGLEAGREDALVGSDGSFLHPPEPARLAHLTNDPAVDPEGDFDLRQGGLAETEPDGSERAAVFDRAAARSDRAADCRTLAAWRKLALDRRRGELNEIRIQEFLRSLSVAERATFEGCWASAELSPPDPAAVGTLLNAIGGPDELIAIRLLERCGSDSELLARRRADLALIARLRRILARSGRGPEGATIDADRIVVWRPRSTGATALAVGLLPELPRGTEIEDLGVGVTTGPTDSPLLEMAVVPNLGGAVSVVARAARGELDAEAQRSLAVVIGSLLIVILGGGAAAWAIWRAARAREAAARVRTEFVARVGHDLRTPLAVIRMYAETIAAARTRTAEESREFAGVVAAEAERLSRLVELVLDLGRLDSGRHGRRRLPVKLAAVVEDVLRAWRPMLDAQGVRATVANADASLIVTGDEDALRALVANLVDNVVVHAAAGGVIDVSVTACGGAAELVVADRGPGLPAAGRAELFERFVRGPGVRSRGAGLGLALVREVARAHGGDVVATDREGGGATFTVTIPRAPSGGAAA